MGLNIIESLKERRNYDRTDNAAQIQLNCKKRGLTLSATLERIRPLGISCFSSVDLDPGEVVNLSIPHMNGVFEAEAMVFRLRKVLSRYELELKFFEMRRDIPSL